MDMKIFLNIESTFTTVALLQNFSSVRQFPVQGSLKDINNHPVVIGYVNAPRGLFQPALQINQN